jgi:hypothetical protein
VTVADATRCRRATDEPGRPDSVRAGATRGLSTSASSLQRWIEEGGRARWLTLAEIEVAAGAERSIQVP